ncbi:helix-turn-helix domain-containing protein [Salinispora cortesiana]|uniref:helix-turn-helix domain-containing protein n=1 Tax=Salinispora cortesiana TaxID=1305843 RepID=UPI0003FB1AAA|nr:helix-turn-helix domain-containing protein [Salinispora cortesiana]
MLGVLGFSPDDETIYRLLVRQGQAGAVELADALRIPVADVAAALSRLTDRGLTKQTAEDVFSVAPPAVALGALIGEQQSALRAAELALVTLAEEYRGASAERSLGELIEVITGVDALRHRFAQVQHAARREVRSFVTPPFIAVPPGANTVESVAVRQGVRFRVVIDRPALAEPGVVAETLESLRDGVQLRVTESLPIKLIIADAALALVPLTDTSAGEPGAVLLHRTGLLAAMDALFEAVWREAHPLTLSAGGTLSEDPDGDADSPTEVDRQILTLLLAGLTDAVLASQLGLSLRTLQRRLRHLMDLAGAASRMQLGWYAAREGWV